MILIALSGASIAQINSTDQAHLPFDSAQGDTTLVDSTERMNILILPFDDKMFFTDLYRELTDGGRIPQENIRNRFRQAAMKSLRSAISDSLKVDTLIRPETIDEEELNELASLFKYRFLAIERYDKKGRLIKAPKDPKKGIVNGQVISERDTTTRYLAATMRDSLTFQAFCDSNHVDRLLVISELDYKYDLSDPNTAFLQPKRLMQMHYTYFNARGKKLTGGLANRNCEHARNNLERIIAENMYRIAASTVHGLKPPPETKKGKKKGGKRKKG
ncbi:MAG: hypothetical protein ACI9FU_000390 [Granulosicoccus sp.]|jgi:hypothetical protein